MAIELAPVYCGTAPYASCHYQCLANILVAQGLSHAEGRICMTWGFTWDGGERLHGSQRWMEVANSVHGVNLAESRFSTPEDAFVAEQELLDRGLPFVVGVDSFHIPSEHTGLTHLPHSVIVLGANADGVSILDPMNLPEVARYTHEDYRTMRAETCVEGTVLFTSGSSPQRDPKNETLLDALLDDLDEHWARGLIDLDAYIDAADERAGVDVCRVGAERLYLAALLRHLAGERPALESVARGMGSLSRRWYLIHTMALQGGDRLRRRCDAMVADMRAREQALSERLRAAVRGEALDHRLELIDDVL